MNCSLILKGQSNLPKVKEFEKYSIYEADQGFDNTCSNAI